MPNWKKLITSGSNAVLNQVTASFFKGVGSNIFGDERTNKHEFTGSVDVSGSLKALTSETTGIARFANGQAFDQGGNLSGSNFFNIQGAYGLTVRHGDGSAGGSLSVNSGGASLAGQGTNTITIGNNQNTINVQSNGGFGSDGGNVTIGSRIFGTGTETAGNVTIQSLGGTNGNAGTISLNASSINISGDTEASGSFSGSFEGDGSGLTGINASIAENATIIDSFSNATSKTVTHNFGTKNVIVQVFDNADKMLLPQEVTTTNTNQVTINLAESTSGRVVVAKGGHIVSQSLFASASTATTATSASHAITASFALNAGAGSGFPFSGSAVITGSLEIISGSFSGDGSGLTNIGSSNLIQAATVTDTFSNTTSKVVTHNFGTKNVLVSVYTNADQQLIPASVTTTNTNSVTVTFNENTSGRVVVAKGGHIVSGLPTGIISQSGGIVDLPNVKIQYANLYSDLSDLPAAANYHGMFAHVHNTGYGYYAHGGAWIQLQNATEAIPTASFALTASFAQNAGGGNVTGSFTNALSSSVTHNFGSKAVIVQVYDDDDFVIQPSSIKANSINQVTVTFSSPESGIIVVGS